MGEGERAGKKGDRSSPQVGRNSHLRGWWSRQITGQFISSEKSGSFCCIVLYMSTCAGHLLQKLVKKCKIANKRRNFSKSHLQSKIRIRLSCDLEQNQIQVLKLFPCKEYDTGFKDLYDVHNLRQLVEQEREARSNNSQRRFSVAKCLLEAIIIGLSALCSPFFSLLCLLK